MARTTKGTTAVCCARAGSACSRGSRLAGGSCILPACRSSTHSSVNWPVGIGQSSLQRPAAKWARQAKGK